MNNKIYAAVAALMLGGLMPVAASVDHLLPKVKELAQKDCSGFALSRQVTIVDETNCELLREVLADAGATVANGSQAKVNVEIVSEIPGAFNHQLAEYPDEAYTIDVAENEINIQALTSTGVIRAAQTLSQLAIGVSEIEPLTIKDWPAFKLRGFMQDVGRSFLSVDELKREIDLMSRFKINTFHWHLTDITGWRLEIKAYPQLTGDAAITRYPGQFYTQTDAKEIQDYAAERGMIVIPEIDMPGHSNPFESAMGHGMQSVEGIAELKVILTEVCALFDKAPYIHIGGDEVGFSDSYIIDMIDYVHNLGKKVVIWNQYNRPAKTVDPNVIPCDLTTNWATSGTLSEGVPNIDMRYNYTNHFDVFADVVGIYKSTIFNSTQGTPDIAGTISAAWCDTKVPDQDAIMRMNNIYANVLASGERAWAGGGNQYIETGGTTLPNSGSEFDEFADWERRFLLHKNTTLKEAAYQIPYVRQTNVKWCITEQIPNGGDKTAVLAPENFIGEESVPETFNINGTTYNATKATGAGIYLRHIWHGTVKGFYQNPQNNMTAYAWTYVYSPIEQDAGAFIEFYSYSRSGNEKGPIAGEWDRRGSRIWLNGEEIAAPQWQQPDKNITQNHATEGLSNENFTNRPATQIHLKEGWNQVFMKLPHVNKGGTGRDKWMFTFVITDPEGNDALDDLVYSTAKCIDSDSEALATLISEARALIRVNIGDNVGYKKSTDLDTNLSAKADELEATLSLPTSAEERVAQIAALQELIDAFNAGIANIPVNQPLPERYYNLYTPLRDNNYASAVGSKLGSLTSPDETSAWKFETRTDGKYNIINYSTKEYIGTANNGKQINLSTSEPSFGWEVKPADEVGYVIIVSGDKQFNQSNNNTGVLNWGNGTNTTDTGCKYMFSLTDYSYEGGGGDNEEDPKYYESAYEFEKDVYYTMSAKRFPGRYFTAVADKVVGETTLTEASAWRFDRRENGLFDIVNYSTGEYISPVADYNTAIHLSATVPPNGWQVKNSDAVGAYIVVSGESQFNQTKASQNFEVYNWGGGTRTDDDGSQIVFTKTDFVQNSATELSAAHCPHQVIYDLQGRRLSHPAKGINLINGKKVLLK
ncbi:MAG: beta-N-acetylhexosaminidase [Bacteroides sp.]|nr:beta-N-acetylhexosaminidase [Bacteroides sp.]MCM1378922.1 beta-N-acetylhexosaminidase [Bacteroides sp.]MCM1445538.1 beta-N-acetylhexosaminidase [Prevotella sp.]